MSDQRKASGLKREWGMGGPIGTPSLSRPRDCMRRACVRLATGPVTGWEGGQHAATRESGDRPCRVKQSAVGCDGQGVDDEPDPYRFRFDRPSPGDRFHPVSAGVFHSSEIEYVFGNLPVRPAAPPWFDSAMSVGRMP